MKDINKRFSDEYNNYNLLGHTLNKDYKIVLSCENILLGLLSLNTDNKIVLSCENIVL